MRERVVWSGVLPWLVEPHHATLARSSDLPADDTVSSSFAFVFDPRHRLLVTHVDPPVISGRPAGCVSTVAAGGPPATGTRTPSGT